MPQKKRQIVHMRPWIPGELYMDKLKVYYNDYKK